jgi:pimeloyl-ACP methyl ester carboxylesterase
MEQGRGGCEKYIEVDGCRICYIDEGQGRPLLFVHGIGGSMTNWAPTVEWFRKSYRVIALDLPCHARSSMVETDGSLEFYALAIRGLLTSIGIDRVSVVGNSLGGLITIHLALNHPEMIENMVLVDTAGAHRFPALLKRAFRMTPPGLLKKVLLFSISYLARYRFFYRLAGIYELNEYTRVLLDEAVATAYRPDLDRYLESYMRTARTALNVSYHDRLGEICKPTLIVWGQKDLGIPLKVGQEVNRMIKGSYLVSIPRAAHVPQLDQPELFNRALSRFLVGASAFD